MIFSKYQQKNVERLQNVLVSDKQFSPQKVEKLLRCDMYNLLNNYINNGVTEAEVNTESDFDLSTAKEKGINAAVAYYLARQKDENITYKDIRNAGYNAEDFKAAGIGVNEALSAEFEHSDLKKSGYGAVDYNAAKVDYNIAKGVFTTEQLATGNYNEAQELLNAIAQIKTAAKNRVTYWDNYKKNEDLLKKKGLSKTQKETYKARKANWYDKYQAVNDEIARLKEIINNQNVVGKRVKSIKNGVVTFYKSGGMNYTTGPAWLDGTRAKPEAVLNATETKNFIALKDILSDVMGHMSNSESTTYGDSTWEININVDHLNNDYDVDKVAKRVEKIITDNASYRNVTMVRKFR